jgi:hypothetical protein
MMQPRLYLVFAGALAASGCVKKIGKGTDAFPVASAPAGVATTVTLRSRGMVSGELLEVRDTALVLRRGTEVLLVPTSAIADAQYQGGDLKAHSLTPDQFLRADLRLLSRYPSGISPRVMSALLSASGKSEPTLLTR